MAYRKKQYDYYAFTRSLITLKILCRSKECMNPLVFEGQADSKAKERCNKCGKNYEVLMPGFK